MSRGALAVALALQFGSSMTRPKSRWRRASRDLPRQAVSAAPTHARLRAIDGGAPSFAATSGLDPLVAEARWLDRLCRDPELLAAFRRDPYGTARGHGFELTAGALMRMTELEEDAVTDVDRARPTLNHSDHSESKGKRS